MVIDKFNIQICQENVLSMIDCFEDSPIYDDVIEEFAIIRQKVSGILKPRAVLKLDGKPSQKIYAVITVGKEISDYVSSLFESGNYLGGMIADAMADDMLFQMESEITHAVSGICKKEKKGISARIEAPNDVPMETQKEIVVATDSVKEIGVDVTESYMLNPVKSEAHIYLLDDDETRMNMEHDCNKCTNSECKMRKNRQINLTVNAGAKKEEFEVASGDSLLDMLKKVGCYIPASCNGKGTCGKCKVKIIRGNISVSREDTALFTAEELAKGYRLACTSYPRFDCVVEIPSHREKGTEILVETVVPTENYIDKKEIREEDDSKGIVVDIGTTTIVMQLVSLQTGKIENTFATVNKQRAYGADVISRIEASIDGQKSKLRESIQADLLTGIKHFAKSDISKVKKVIIAANTTMVHLLMGYDCDTLGVYPFTPVNIETIETSLNELLDTDVCDAKVIIYPGISTYVGGDIVSGLFALGYEDKENVSILIDLGTNGEMAIGNKDKILVTSTAAGPAFEAGNITCGVASVPGAICNVDINSGEVEIKTIGDAAAKGICGTGVIETVAELLKNELLDETGLFEDEYFETGYRLAGGDDNSDISIYQKDIREIQLAKSAVRAGVETLISHYGITYDKIEHIYIAGGFGYKMNIDKAIAIGLLPEELKSKIEAVGNACLSGVNKYLLKKDCEQDIKQIIDSALEVQLSSDKEFNNLYVEYMYFE